VNQATRIYFTGGGTAGHVYPGLAVAGELKKEAAARGIDAEILWIGSRKGMERGIVEAAGISFAGIASGKLRRYISYRNIIDVFRILLGVIQAYVLIRGGRPAVIFSKGGYVSVPPVFAARIAGIATVTHESDFDPGLATKINAKSASEVIVSYEQTKGYFPEGIRKKVYIAGNPVRSEILSGRRESGLRFLGFPDTKPLLLVVGGSQGAKRLNGLVKSVLPELLKSWNVVHQTGASASNIQDTGEAPGYRQFEYIENEYGDILAASDLVLCRAGATTLDSLPARSGCEPGRPDKEFRAFRPPRGFVYSEHR
jgi:UDP-N-acetylglucosamine--N-acetylmuramyl-(pentapeptide) pyrophosphoryl-undecaprenol N-acetylglucosamine transferase